MSDELESGIDAAVHDAIGELTAPVTSVATEGEVTATTPDPVSEVISSTPIGSVFTRTHGGWAVQIPGINGLVGHGVGANIPDAIASIGAVVTGG